MDEIATVTDSAQTPSIALAVDLTSKIVAAYVANNRVSLDELPSLITSVHRALVFTDRAMGPAAEPEKLVPAVPVKRSVTPDYIVCLEDGKQLKMLKRHLNSVYGLSPDEYRAKWGLPADYPMVAPNYAAQRSSFAKSIRLGQRRVGEVANAAEPAPVKKPARRKKSVA